MALKLTACQLRGKDLKQQAPDLGQEEHRVLSQGSPEHPPTGEVAWAPASGTSEPGQVQRLSVESVSLPSKAALSFPLSEAGQQTGGAGRGTSSLFQESLGPFPLPSSCLVVV